MRREAEIQRRHLNLRFAVRETPDAAESGKLKRRFARSIPTHRIPPQFNHPRLHPIQNFIRTVIHLLVRKPSRQRVADRKRQERLPLLEQQSEVERHKHQKENQIGIRRLLVTPFTHAPSQSSEETPGRYDSLAPFRHAQLELVEVPVLVAVEEVAVLSEPPPVNRRCIARLRLVQHPILVRVILSRELRELALLELSLRRSQRPPRPVRACGSALG
mmetsp:Transcript_478/g.1662  ORF Transcript_478/g.1662 Transcript_478/m.1662 type:complete len:217 (+) Transcript_478:543-1193(+)